ncbi:hypothetical protein WJX81_007269 [Elliptochloris bilobata]|uniref:Transmembrane protein 186 n=1 Tax=Elliptochloris bilobata TaxID=381761 RepID=A0AAW1RN83_9CHLO
MVPFRVLVRLKVFQLAGVAGLAIPINSFLGEGEVTGVQVLLAGLLVVGSGVASTTLWFFSQRYVGELAALPPAAPGGAERLRFSVLDFWGNRQEHVVRAADVIPPFEGLERGAAKELAGQGRPSMLLLLTGEGIL